MMKKIYDPVTNFLIMEHWNSSLKKLDKLMLNFCTDEDFFLHFRRCRDSVLIASYLHSKAMARSFYSFYSSSFCNDVSLVIKLIIIITTHLPTFFFQTHSALIFFFTHNQSSVALFGPNSGI